MTDRNTAAIFVIFIAPAILPIIFHYLMKPKFWLPSFLSTVIGIAITFLFAVAGNTIIKSAQMSIAFGVILFGMSIFVGFIMRVIFAKEYNAASIKETKSRHFAQRSRIVGAVGFSVGALILYLGFSGATEKMSDGAMLGGFLFVGLGLYYMLSKDGGATLGQWVFKGKLSNDTSED